MSVEIVVPQVGEAVSEVTLVRWLKQEGDAVRQGEPLFEVDTDKAVVEVEAFASGTLAQILVPEGSPVLPQQVVGILQPEGEPLTRAQAEEEPAPAGPPAPKAQLAPEAPPASSRAASPLAQRVASELGVDLRAVPGSGPGGRVTAEDVRRFSQDRSGREGAAAPAASPATVIASPKARRLARQLGVDLRRVTGTGVDGMITAGDVEAASGAPAPEHPPEIKPFTKMRQAVARRMLASKQQIPHFYLMVDVDMTAVQKLRLYCTGTLSWEAPPTYTDIILRACALALARNPDLNVQYSDQGILARQSVDIGVAVALEDGLIVPVLRQVDRLNLQQVSEQLRELAGRARSGRLRERDLASRSMVVSNLGMYGIDAFAAIIDMPDPMILAVGRVADAVVPVGGAPAVRPMCTLTLSIDHRVLDGAQGAQFLASVKDYLESPFELLR